MHARWTRFVAASTLTVAIAGTGLIAGTGSASAATPIIIGNCATSVEGVPGTPVELSPSAVVTPLVNIVNAVPLLGPVLAPQFQSAFDALPPIPLGALPNGSGYITGGQIATAVVAAIKPIPLLGPILGTVVTGVQSALTSGCGVAVQGVNAAVAPVQDGTQALANAGTQLGQSLGLGSKTSTPGGGSGPGGSQSPPGTGPGAPQGGNPGNGQGLGSNVPVTGPSSGLANPFLLNNPAFGAAQLLDAGLAQSPLARYSGIPFASAGVFAPSPGVRYGGSVPGYSPSYGVLNNSGTPQPDGIQTAGEAEALNPGSLPGGNGIGLPMLLAVLALSGATAGLVRTWVLRRVRAI